MKMDVLSQVETDPFGSVPKFGNYGVLNASGGAVNLPTMSEWMNSIGVVSPSYHNLHGAELEKYNVCKVAYDAWAVATQQYQQYLAALAAWQASFDANNCGTLLQDKPPVPVYIANATDVLFTNKYGSYPKYYQSQLPASSNVCVVNANAAALKYNTDVDIKFNQAMSQYNAAVNACAPAKPYPVSNPGVFVPPAGDVPIGFDGIGFDGMNQYMSANGNGYRNAVVKMKGGKLNASGKMRNCAGCTALAALAANGEPYLNATVKMKGGKLVNAEGDVPSTQPNWLTIAMLVGGTFLLYKIFIRK